MSALTSPIAGAIGELVGGKKPKAAAPAREIIQATDEARRAASALRARRIGGRGLLGSTLGPDEEKRTTLGVG